MTPSTIPDMTPLKIPGMIPAIIPGNDSPGQSEFSFSSNNFYSYLIFLVYFYYKS